MALKTLMNPVRSTALKSVGYDRGTLWVEFQKSGLYEYRNVPESLYRALAYDRSKGAFFDRHIKGRYQARKIH